MNNEKLAKACEAIQDFRPKDALEILQGFENEFPHTINMSDIPQLESQLRRMANLAAAARDGAAAAKSQFTELLGTPKNLGIYDRSGGMQRSLAAPSNIRKF